MSIPTLLTVLTLSSLFTASGYAKTLEIRVDGMICDFCATGMKKKFHAEPGVKSVSIDLTRGLVTVETEGAADVSDERIKKLVDYSGNDFVSVIRK